MSRPDSMFDTPTADKHIANLALFVRLQVPWSKPTSGIESGFAVDTSRVASVPHLVFAELAAAGRELLRRTDEWEKWLRACGDCEVSDADGAFARPEDVEYGTAVTKNNQAVALLLEGALPVLLAPPAGLALFSPPRLRLMDPNSLASRSLPSLAAASLAAGLAGVGLGPAGGSTGRPTPFSSFVVGEPRGPSTTMGTATAAGDSCATTTDFAGAEGSGGGGGAGADAC